MINKEDIGKKIVTFGPVKSVVVVGIASAALGYVANSNVKKLASSINGGLLKEKSVKFGKASKAKLAKYQGWGLEKSKKTADQIKMAATRLVTNEEREALSKKKNESEKRAEWLKEENEQLSERLSLLEEKLKNLGQQDLGEETNNSKNEKKSSESKGKKKSKSETSVSSDDDTVSANQ